MTTSLEVRHLTAALRRAAVRATLAPSVHNTQPWQFRLGPNELTLLADRTRQLRVLDPTGRQLTISCGCALFNARVAIAAAGFSLEVDRFPDLARNDVLARITAADAHDGSVDPIAALDNVVELRHTNRRLFADDDVPGEVVDALERAAEAEDSGLFVIRSEDDQLTIAQLSERADAIQVLDPAYRAELRAWTSDDPSRLDGLPGAGRLPAEIAGRRQCLLLLGSRIDDPAGWLRTGEALERILLEATRHGFAAGPLTQIVEVASARADLRAELGLAMYPHILLRIGRAPTTPATRRRRLVDMLVETA